MKAYLFISWVSIFLVCIGISGCFEGDELSNEEKRFIGTWDMTGLESPVIFHSNGELDGFVGEEFEVTDGKLAVLKRFAGGYRQELYTYTFTHNDTKLILININSDITHTLTKQ